MADLRAVTSQARRLFARYRRVLGALLAAVAVLGIIESMAPADPPSRRVVVAAHDLDAGALLTAGDVRAVPLPPTAVPGGAASDPARVIGRVVAGPMRAGEAVTDLRLVGRSLVARYPPGTVAAPVRIGDPDVVALLRVGDRIDVFAAGRDRSSADVVVAGVRVVALPEGTDSSHDGALVVVAVTTQQAADLAEAAATAPLSVALLR